LGREGTAQAVFENFILAARSRLRVQALSRVFSKSPRPLLNVPHHSVERTSTIQTCPHPEGPSHEHCGDSPESHRDSDRSASAAPRGQLGTEAACPPRDETDYWPSAWHLITQHRTTASNVLCGSCVPNRQLVQLLTGASMKLQDGTRRRRPAGRNRAHAGPRRENLARSGPRFDQAALFTSRARRTKIATKLAGGEGAASPAAGRCRRLLPSGAAQEARRKNGTPRQPSVAPSSASNESEQRDVFISHASEDKDAIARPLAEELRGRGHSVWFDEFELTLGNSLGRSIEDSRSAASGWSS